MHKMQSLRASLLREFEERRSGDLADVEMLRRQLEESRGERLKLVEGMQESVEEEATRRGEAAGELHRLEFEASQAKSKLEMDRLSHQNQQFQVQLESQQQQQRQREEAVEEMHRQRLEEMRGFLAEAKEEARQVREEKVGNTL